MKCLCPEEAKISQGLYPAYKKVKDRVLYYNPSPVKQKPIPDLKNEEDSYMDVDDGRESDSDEEYVVDLRDSSAEHEHCNFLRDAFTESWNSNESWWPEDLETVPIVPIAASKLELWASEH